MPLILYPYNPVHERQSIGAAKSVLISNDNIIRRTAGKGKLQLIDHLVKVQRQNHLFLNRLFGLLHFLFPRTKNFRYPVANSISVCVI